MAALTTDLRLLCKLLCIVSEKFSYNMLSHPSSVEDSSLRQKLPDVLTKDDSHCKLMCHMPVLIRLQNKINVSYICVTLMSVGRRLETGVD